MSVDRCTAVFLAVLAISRSAVAAEPTKTECVAANGAAQDLRSAGKLREARVKLAVCISASCPGPIREDCGERLREVEKVTPSIVFEAKDAAGNDLSAVVVTMDGQPLAMKLDGAALIVDPGEHQFSFDADGLPSAEKKLVIREGERDRHERIVLGGAKKEKADAPLSTNEAPSRVPAIIAFGAGGVGLIFGIAFTAGAIDAQSKCSATMCDPSVMGATQEDKGKNNAGVVTQNTSGAVIGFLAAGAGAAVGTILLLTSSRATPSNAVSIRPQLGVGWAGIEGRF